MIRIEIDGKVIQARPGDTVAAAVIASSSPSLRLDSQGRPRGFYCNMGVCGECTVDVISPSGQPHGVRACLTTVVEGMRITTRSWVCDV